MGRVAGDLYVAMKIKRVPLNGISRNMKIFWFSNQIISIDAFDETGSNQPLVPYKTLLNKKLLSNLGLEPDGSLIISHGSNFMKRLKSMLHDNIRDFEKFGRQHSAISDT